MDNANAIAMGALCIAPDDQHTIYAGTGEQVVGANIFLGAGLLKSTDDGATWSVVGLPRVGSFSRVIIHPNAPSTIVASCMNEQAGVWKSIDRGATWQRMFEGQVYDMTIDASDDKAWTIAVQDSGIMSTIDGGLTWQRRMNGLIGKVGRASVQQSVSSPNVMYTLMELNDLAVIAKSTDKGLSWSIQYQDQQGCFFSGTCVPSESQGFYDNVIAIDPRNADHVIAGGIDLFLTTNGGSEWTNTTNGYSDGDGNSHPHVDQHAITFDPLDPTVVYAGNDGGVMRSADGGVSWLPINAGLSVTQFYAFDVDRTSRNRMFGGTQDNGTIGTNGAVDWDTLYGGDGMTTLIDPSNSNILYGSGPEGELFKLNLSTMSRSSLTTGIDLAEECEWVAPVVIDPLQPSVLFTGRERIYRSEDGGNNWEPISPRFSNTVSAIAISPIDDEVIWAGGSWGDVVLSTNYGNTWSSVFKRPLSQLFVSDIVCARRNRNVAWITYSSYGTPQVWKTTDLGTSWFPVWNQMPNVPVNSLVLHPDDDNVAFIGTDIGVFATYDGGRNWSPFGIGLPRSPVLELRADVTFSYLRAATHGRGIWETSLRKQIATEPLFIVPAGGERYPALSAIPISWDGIEAPFEVSFTTNNGESWKVIAVNVVSKFTLWTVPNTPSTSARIRVQTLAAPITTVESKDFSIIELQRGVILDSRAMSWTAYGLSWDGRDGLWTTDIHSPNLYKLHRDRLDLTKVIPILGAGDSLFTDLTFDRDSGLIYVHRLDDFNGTSTTVFVLDTFGVVKRSFPSQARRYGTGLELINGDLIGTERDGEQRIVRMDPQNGNVRATTNNPYRTALGPRCIAADGLGSIIQAHTSFPPGGGKLSSVIATKIPLSNLDTITDRLLLESRKGLINARGVEIDHRDQTMWVSDIDRVIWKIAGMNYVPPITSVAESTTTSIHVQISPHPIRSSSIITVYPNGLERTLNVEIYDVTGRLMVAMPASVQSAESVVTFRLHADTITDGTYLLRVSSPHTPDIRRTFVVTH
ncbi:MAG: hypothetical protein H7X70_03765 [Candidatus Kapabacteria bacterium]|nr:hypothetical protein [Candidatus Kapabacteria bacterium]